MTIDKLKQLGRYKIESELGRGAMGVVYKALDPLLDRTVALKIIVLGDDALERAEYHSRFFQEAKAAARLNHPSLITIYDFGEEGSLAYMAMELLQGTGLSERMAKGGIPIREAISIAEQVAEGLAYAHDNEVIHRDIKPGNIILLPRRRVKVMDFGIARMESSELKTQLGTRLGTPKYMSPEQSTGSAVDHRTDIFSLGIVLYEMLTGAKLFTGENLNQVLNNVATFEPPLPSRIRPEISHTLDLVVKRAIAKKKEDRYANAWEMYNDLQLCLQELAPGTTVNEAPEQSFESTIIASGEKTLVMKSSSDTGSFNLRRISDKVETSSRLIIAPRFDSSVALARLQTPSPRDLQRLARLPKAPGFLLRMLRDRTLAWLSISTIVSLLLAAVLALS